MKKIGKKGKKGKQEFRSFTDLIKYFYPNPVDPELTELPNPKAVGERLAQQSLNRLQAALAEK
jgi:hypothetical protein